MLLRQLLRLLLVLLFQFLRLSVACLLLVLRFLLLLKLRPLLRLCRDQLVLLLLIFRIGLCIARMDWRGASNRREILWVHCGFWLFVGFRGSRGCCHGRLAGDCSRALLRVGARSLHTFSLSRDSWNVSLTRGRLLFGSCPRFDPTFSAIVTDAALGVDFDSFIVGIVNVHNINVID